MSAAANMQGKQETTGARSPIARARLSFNAALPRQGRIVAQCRRAFIAHDFQPVSMAELKRWAYPGREHRHWMYWSIKRALRKLGARRIGRAGGIGRPAVWAIQAQGAKLIEAHTENVSADERKN